MSGRMPIYGLLRTSWRQKKQQTIFSLQYPFMLLCYQAEHEGVSKRLSSSRWHLLKHTNCDVGPEDQSGSLALSLYHLAIYHLCISNLVAWLSDSQCQKMDKQNPKTCLFMDEGCAHHPECYGSTHLPSSTWLGGWKQGKVSCTETLESGVFVYLHCKDMSVLMWLQRLNPIFSMGNHIMRPADNFEPKYMVIIPTRQEWTERPRPPPVVNGLVWYTDGSRTQGRDWCWSLSAILGKEAHYLPW
jgi:hypothetical protein